MPEPMREHTLANMRDHLRSLQEIDEALAKGDFDKASATYARAIGAASGQNPEASECLADAQASPETWQDRVGELLRGAPLVTSGIAQGHLDLSLLDLGNDPRCGVLHRA